MSTLGRTRLRLAGDTARFDAPLESARRATPQFWRGTDLQFEVGVFHNGTLQSVANLASLTLELRPLGASGLAPDPATPPVMARTIEALDDSVTAETWTSGAKQHALVPFSNLEANIPPGLYWLSLWVLTSDEPARLITLAAGPLRVLEDGAGPTAAPPSASEAYLTAAQSEMTFAKRALNLNDLADKPAARANLGLGTAAIINVPATGDAAAGEAVKGNDSRLANARPPTAHTHPQADITNLTVDLAAKAPLASPALSGAPTAPTAAVTANSTHLATTAWVRDFLASSQRMSCPTNTSFWALTKSGSGVESFAPFGVRMSTSTSAGLCRVFAGTGNAPVCRGAGMETIDFSKRTEFSCKLVMITTNADATCRVTIGKQSGDGHGALARKGFGVLIQNTTLKVIAHNGTTETVGATGHTLTQGVTLALRVVSNGSGSVSFYVNDTLVETITGGPTGSSSNQAGLMCEIDNNASANGNSAAISPVDMVFGA